ncbi:MAG: hypothetical protein WCG25_07200 [bacterium]
MDATKIIDQPFHQSPPDGHQNASLASLLPEAIPSHHLPDSILILTSS